MNQKHIKIAIENEEKSQGYEMLLSFVSEVSRIDTVNPYNIHFIKDRAQELLKNLRSENES